MTLFEWRWDRVPCSGNAIVDNVIGIDNDGITSTKGDNTIERNTTDLSGVALTAYTPR